MIIIITLVFQSYLLRMSVFLVGFLGSNYLTFGVWKGKPVTGGDLVRHPKNPAIITPPKPHLFWRVPGDS